MVQLAVKNSEIFFQGVLIKNTSCKNLRSFQNPENLVQILRNNTRIKKIVNRIKSCSMKKGSSINYVTQIWKFIECPSSLCHTKLLVLLRPSTIVLRWCEPHPPYLRDVIYKQPMWHNKEGRIVLLPTWNCYRFFISFIF